MRFSPPPLALDDDQRWLLLRAFGPSHAIAPSPDPERVLALAKRSSLASRIAKRTPPEQLTAELGASANQFAAATRKSLRHALAYEALAATVAGIARDLGSPLIVLKGVALHLAGHIAAGSREIGDLDVLIADDRLENLQRALFAAGFEPAAGESNEHHLPPMRAPGWGVIDVHFTVHGVTSGDTESWLTATQAAAAAKATANIPGLLLPNRELLAAHAVAHGIDQHGLSPLPLPLLRMVADLADLLPTAADWQHHLPALAQRLRASVSHRELAAIATLCEQLTAGRSPEPATSPAAILLAHLLAHAFDPEYRAGLGRRHFRHRLRHAWQRGTLLRYAARKLADRRRGRRATEAPVTKP